MEEQKERDERRQPNTLLLLTGFVVLGMAAAFLLFGADLFEPQRPEAGSIPAGDWQDAGPQPTLDPIVAQLPDRQGQTPQIGTEAPDFVLSDLENNPVRLQDFRGQPVVVNFWATWCAPCLVEMPELQAAYEEHQDEGFVILAVNREEDAATVRDFFYERLGLTFTPLLDEQAFAAGLYNVFNMPTTFFVNPDGVITAVHRGPMTRGQIDAYLAEMNEASG